MGCYVCEIISPESRVFLGLVIASCVKVPARMMDIHPDRARSVSPSSLAGTLTPD